MKIFKEFCFLIGLVHQIMRLNEEPLRSVALVPEEIWSVAFLFEKQKQDETRFWTIIVTWQTMKSHDKYFRWEKQLSTVTMMMTTTMMSTTSTQVRFSLYPRFRVGDSSRRRQKEAFSLEKKTYCRQRRRRRRSIRETPVEYWEGFFWSVPDYFRATENLRTENEPGRRQIENQQADGQIDLWRARLDPDVPVVKPWQLSRTKFNKKIRREEGKESNALITEGQMKFWLKGGNL